MAHLVTGYAGYAHVKSADDGAFNASFFGGGQYAMEFGNCFAGSIIDNNTVRILDGDGLMYGRHFRIEPNSYEDMTITTGTAGTNRIDLICMTYEKNADDETERCYLQVIKGTETQGTAVAPEYTDGNILEGASFNQMPLYKVTIEGVVLKEIEPMFETIPTYKALAEYYAGVFQDRCDEILENLPIDALTPEDVVDNLLSESATLPLSAKQGKVLDEKIDEQNKNFGGLRFGVDGDGNGGYYKADDSFVPFSGLKLIYDTSKNGDASITSWTGVVGKKYVIVYTTRNTSVSDVNGAIVNTANQVTLWGSGGNMVYMFNIVCTCTSTNMSLTHSGSCYGVVYEV